MATLVHITDANLVSAIRRNGIRPARPRRVIYFMPVVQSHLVSHQWLRELRRRGTRSLVGVYFQWPKDTIVWAGHYNEAHQQMALSEAVRSLHVRPDPLGFEMFAERSVRRNEINAVRALPQTIGWRYMPGAHGLRPCPCPACQRGQMRAAAIRALDDQPRELPPMTDVYAHLEAADEPYDPGDDLAMWRLRDKRRRISPAFLAKFLKNGDPDAVLDLAETLPYLRHPLSREMLKQLLAHANVEVSAAARAGLATWSD